MVEPNPFEKYGCQIGSLPQGSGWKIKKYLICHHLVHPWHSMNLAGITLNPSNNPYLKAMKRPLGRGLIPVTGRNLQSPLVHKLPYYSVLGDGWIPQPLNGSTLRSQGTGSLGATKRCKVWPNSSMAAAFKEESFRRRKCQKWRVFFKGGSLQSCRWQFYGRVKVTTYHK